MHKETNLYFGISARKVVLVHSESNVPGILEKMLLNNSFHGKWFEPGVSVVTTFTEQCLRQG